MSARTPQRAYLDLQKLARAQGRNTQQLFELYIHERFLARLASSRFSEMFVLKGGMLLAVLEVRRPTRDADMLARGLARDEGKLRAVVGEIAAVPMADGVSFDASEISAERIREDADYEGVRLALPSSLAGAALKLRLDLAAAGAPLRAIQEWVGHADAKTTEIYRHYAPDPTHGAAFVDRAFGGGRGPRTDAGDRYAPRR